MKRLYKVLIWVFALTGLIVTMSFVSTSQDSTPCSSVFINVDNTNVFIDKNDVDSLIKKRVGTLKGKSMDKIDIAQIENIIRGNSYVQNAQAYSTIDGEVSIAVRLRVPLLRIFNPLNQSFYVDANGRYMPLSEKASSRVLMVNGYIYDSYIARTVRVLDWKDTMIKGKTMMDSLYTLANFIQKDKFLNAQIQQAYINNDREIELIPYIGKQTIIMGDISDMDLKFKNLVSFYKKEMSRYGWSTCSCINLKYKNQIVCTKTNKFNKQND